MDPNAALASIREEIKELRADSVSDVETLADLVEGLDEWLSKGGFAPEDWNSKAPEVVGPGLVNAVRVPSEGEVKALVTIEATERLVNRARRALMGADIDETHSNPDPEWAGMLLEQAAEITTTRTCTAVKSQALSDEISVKADDIVAPAVAKAREIQRQVREARWAAEDEARRQP